MWIFVSTPSSTLLYDEEIIEHEDSIFFCRTKVTTLKWDTSRSATPVIRPMWSTACLQSPHKFPKVTNGSSRDLWGSQWKLKHVVLESVLIRTSLVSYLG
jgi:hypothetical protein